MRRDLGSSAAVTHPQPSCPRHDRAFIRRSVVTIRYCGSCPTGPSPASSRIRTTPKPKIKPRGAHSVASRTVTSGWACRTAAWPMFPSKTSSPPLRGSSTRRIPVVATLGPDGIFGHPDHIAIGAAADEAFARLRSEHRSGFQRLAHGAVPQTVFERWNQQRAQLGLTTFDPTQTYHMRGIADEQRERRVRREGYAIAWPEHGRDTPMFTDLDAVGGANSRRQFGQH